MYPLNKSSPSSSPQPLATTILLFVSVSVTALGNSCKWNHITIVLFYLAYFILYNVLKIHQCCVCLVMAMCCFVFILLVGSVALVDVYMLDPACIPRINHIGHGYIILCYLLLDLVCLYFVEKFAFVFTRDISL